MKGLLLFGCKMPQRDLFTIETDKVLLTWSKARDKETTPLGDIETVPGRLIIKKHRKDLIFGDRNWRCNLPEKVAKDTEHTTGPLLFEQTDYYIYAKSKSNTSVGIQHQDPQILSGLITKDDTVQGFINFGAQVGISEFSVLSNNQREFDFEVEVFPTKLDYTSDYEQLLAKAL